MNIPRTLGWGLVLAASTAVISGFSVFANSLIVGEFGDPVALAGARNSLVGIALVAALVAGAARRRGRPEAQASMSRPRLAGLLAVAVIGGSVPFILFFSGLALATGPGAALIHKTMFVWVAMLAVPLLGERLGVAQVVAMGALLLGTLFVGPTATSGAGTGELLILAATLLWSLEVILVKRLLDGGLPVAHLAAARMALGAVLILGFLAWTGRIDAISGFGAWQWGLIAVTGLLLLGYVTTWYAALQRAPASVVSSILVGGAVITGLLAAVRAGTVPAVPAAAGLALVAIGVAAVLWSTLRLPGTVPAEATAPAASAD